MSDLRLHYVYFIREANSHYVKIGYAVDVNRRLIELQIGTPHQLEVLYTIQVESADAAREIEAAMHRRFDASLVRGEWYVLGQRDMDEIKLLATVANESAKAARLIWQDRYRELVARVRHNGQSVVSALRATGAEE